MKFMKNVFKGGASSKSRDSSKADEIHGDVLIINDCVSKDTHHQEDIQEMESSSLKIHTLSEMNEEKQENNNETKVIGGRCNLCLYEEDSWQVLVVKPIKKEENKAFLEALSFWKEQEKLK
ncbi:hypothetical protein PIB30_076965 [Stylosanthes scabra]|uniref:Uncharacterized protein n=1 Tax=Stylosanthes scabra TaxID=79078 RepID=A0ABU6RQ95_9FABA|nr:hypothetical protein [Stylosanthes scabra]